MDDATHERVQALSRLMRERHLAIKGDVQAAFDAVRKQHGRFDVAVCTPSVNVRKPILAYADEEFEKVVSLKLGATSTCCARRDGS